MNLQKRLTAQEIEALSSGLLGVLQKLIGPLIGSMSLERLQEIVTRAFIQEAERQLRKEYAGRSVPKSQLALLTGLDTRQLNKIQAGFDAGNAAGEPSYTSQLTPLTTLIDYWSTNPDYLDESESKPRPLPIQGPAPSVEAMMRSTKVLRGVTPRSIADRLVLGGSASEDEDGLLHLATWRWIPSSPGDIENAIDAGCFAIEKLVDTFITNLELLNRGEPRLYQRTYWSSRIPPHREQELRERITALMKQFQEESTAVMKEQEMQFESPSQVSAGFGLFYFQSEGSDEPRQS